MTRRNGTLFLLANGPALPAGTHADGQLTNLPVAQPRRRATWRSALAAGDHRRRRLAGVRRARRTAAIRGRGSIERRDALLARARRARSAAPATAPSARRSRRAGQRLLAELEHIYGELDEAQRGPQGGGEGVAA